MAIFSDFKTLYNTRQPIADDIVGNSTEDFIYRYDSTTQSFLKFYSIDKNLTINVGTLGTPDFANLQDAFNFLQNKKISENKLVTIQLTSEIFSSGSAIILNHKDGDKIKILGTSLSAGQSVSTWTYVDATHFSFNAGSNPADLVIGMGVIVSGANNIQVNGAFKISDIVGNIVTILGNFTNVAITNGTVSYVRSTLQFTGCNGLVISKNNNIREINYLSIFGNSTNYGILASDNSIFNYTKELNNVSSETDKTFNNIIGLFEVGICTKNNSITSTNGTYYTLNTINIRDEDQENFSTKRKNVLVKNTTGSTIPAFKVVKLSGYESSTDNVLVTPITTITDKAYGITMYGIATGNTGEVLQSGEIKVGLNTSAATLLDIVYCDVSGNLTLTPSKLELGYVLTLESDGAIVIETSASSSSSGGSSSVFVTQANTFTVGQPIYFNVSSWELAKADSITTLGVAIVDSASVGSFNAVFIGKISITSHGLGSAGNFLYTSEQTAGLLTTTVPSVYVNPLAIIIDAGTIFVLNWQASSNTSNINYIQNTDLEIGAFQRFASLDIDGTFNLINNNILLYTQTTSYFSIPKLFIVNRNSINANIRVIFTPTSTITNDEYLLYDYVLIPNSTKIIDIPILESGYRIYVYSSIISVNFVLSGSQYYNTIISKNFKGSLDIDGSTNLINNNYSTFTATDKNKISAIICNRNNGIAQISLSTTSSTPTNADYLFNNLSIPANDVLYLEDFAYIDALDKLFFKSTLSNVNILVFSRQQAISFWIDKPSSNNFIKTISMPSTIIPANDYFIIHEITVPALMTLTVRDMGISIINDTAPDGNLIIEIGSYSGTFTQLNSTSLRYLLLSSNQQFSATQVVQFRVKNNNSTSKQATAFIDYILV